MYKVCMFKPVIIFAATLALATTAVAEIVQSTSVKQLEAGVICPPDSVGTTIAPDTLAGATHIIEEDPPFVSNSRVVPAALGVGFGVKAQSIAPGGLSGVIVRVTHPPMGDNGRRSQSFLTSMSGQSPSITFYQFDHAYELVEGTWTMAAYAGDTELLSVTFEVVDPSMVPQLANVCNFADMLS